MLVWSDKVDGKYDVRVERTDERYGTLRVFDGDRLLYEERVYLSYGAIFGPDVDDVSYWQATALKIVDQEKGQ